MIAKINLNFLVLAELITCLVCIFTLGFFNFLGLVFAGMIVGIILLAFSFKNLSLLKSQASFKSALQNTGFCFAGVLFLIPGILSSVAAVVVVFASIITGFLAPKGRGFYEENSSFFENKTYENNAKNYKKDDSDIIDVEIIEDRK